MASERVAAEALATGASASEDKDRDQRILSAKKKLKSYRAKQALMAKRASGSRQLASAQVKRLSKEASATVTSAVQDTILRATEQAQQALHDSSPASASAESSSKRHSRSHSRAGHGRGHSRAGSISITADRMAINANMALRNSFLSQRPEEQAALSSASSSSTIVPPTANAHVAHTRQHSRSASRRVSTLGLGGLTPSSSNPTLLAVEHGPDSFGASGKPSDWADVPGKGAAPLEDAASPVPSPMATPKAVSKPLSAVPTADYLFNSVSSDVSHNSSSSATRRLSRHARKTSLATKRESMELMGGLGFPSASGPHDIIGGSAPPTLANRRNSRRTSGNRFSGIQSASVLFGAPDRRSGLPRDFDWRGSLGLAQQPDDLVETADDSGDRRTALEKLEGRSAAAPTSSANSRPLSFSTRRHSRTHSRQSSVQLPSFDDIHGDNGMDKRNSTTLLELNERTTAEESDRSTSAVSAPPKSPWLGIPSSSSLGSINTILANGIAGMSHSQSSPELLSNSRSPKPRPMSLFAPPESPHPEGLGTLMEEEEEEDITSPIKERNVPSFSAAEQVEDEEAQRMRREEERETIKRTRRSSLQPKPLKLKSRPASLFVSPAMQMKANLLLSSPSLASSTVNEDHYGSTTEESNDESVVPFTNESEMSAASTRDSATGRTTPGNLSREWSMSAAQAKARSGLDEDQVRTGTPTRLQNRRESIPLSLSTRFAQSADNSQDLATGDSSLSSPSSAKPGMRALRLGSISAGSQSSISDGGHSAPISLAQRRASYVAASQSGGSISERSDTVPSSVSQRSLRRSSIIYKPSTDSAANNTASSAASPVTPSATVPSSIMTALEELKAKALRDAGTMEEQRKHIEKLTIDLSSESQRASREYAQLEQWSAEERQQLVARLEDSQSETASARQALTEAQSSLKTTEEKLATQQREEEERMEDLQAERDMLQDDVEGWRTRCGDLEKSLRADKAALEEERQHSYSLALRVQTLMHRLKEEGIDVPTTPTADDVTSRQLGLPADLLSALRTPAPYAPSVSTPSGYFSPRASPADAAPPPQAVKLLKDMRQQIFNLAGSLEHQRKEQLKSQEEADTLRKQNEELKAALELASSGRIEHASGDDEEHVHTDDDAFHYDQPTADIPLSTSFERRNTGKQRHVFAYDSSMGSVDQSNTSMCSTSHTNLTSMSDHSSSATPDEKVDHEGSAEAVLPLPVLQPLVEEEDEARSVQDEDGESEATRARRQSYLVHDHSSMSSFDLEAGGDSYDQDEGEAESTREGELYNDVYGHLEDGSTPLASQTRLAASLQKTPVVSLEGQILSLSSQSGGSASQSARSSGTTCSLDTPGPASLGDDEEERTYQAAEDEYDDVERFAGDSHDAIDQSGEDYYGGDEEDEDIVGPYSRDRKDRPEFIREWSFQEALQSARPQKVGAGGKGQNKMRRRAAPRPPSVDDFFGLLLCEQLEPLPPLPTTHSSLEMPPVYVESLFHGENAPPYNEATGNADVYHPSRHSAVVSTRQASMSGSKVRPPVARSAYTRESLSSTGAVVRPSSRPGSVGMAAAMVDGGSRALSRVSLQGLTSAFSGLGGYLAGSSGAAVHAAAKAGTMCSSDMDDIESRNPSISWPSSGDDYQDDKGLRQQSQHAFVPQQRVQSMAGISGVKRFSAVSNNGAAQRPMDRRISSSTTASSTTYTRRFISRDNVVPPSPSPVWSLDFLPCTEVAGGPGAFSV